MTDTLSGGERPAGRSAEIPMRFTTETALRVLVVDDDRQIRSLLSRYLGTLGCEVATAEELEEAVALIENRRYDVVVTDLGLTRLGRSEGVDVVTRARYRWPNLRIVVLTGSNDPEIRAACFEGGADAFLVKPPSLDDLGRLVLGSPSESS